jgi:hypothetical protein
MNIPKLSVITLLTNGLMVAYDTEDEQMDEITLELNKQTISEVTLLWFKMIIKNKEISFTICKWEAWEMPIDSLDFIELSWLRNYKQQLLTKVRKHAKNT